MSDGTNHLNPNTEYAYNALYEAAPGSGQYVPPGGPFALRDTDQDGTPGPIDCIKTRGVNVRQNWLGETIHFQNVITQTFEIFFQNPSQQKDLSRWIEKLNNNIGDPVLGFGETGLWHEEIDLYGIKIPNCRIISLSAPTSNDRNQDAIGRGKINITVEQRTCGDLEDLENRERTVVAECYQCTEDGVPKDRYEQGAGLDSQADALYKCGNGVDEDITVGAIQADDVNCAGGAIAPFDVNDYAGVKDLLEDVCPFIDDINEDFKFDYGKGNNISFTHSINIKLFDSCPKGVDPFTVGSGPGTPGIEWGLQGNITPEGILPGQYSGDDGDMTDGFSMCRPGQYNVDDALTLARLFLDTSVPHFGIAFHGGVLKTIDDAGVVPYYTETQNLITGEVSMTKKMNLLKLRDNDLDWSADYTHSLSINQSGIATVTERGKVIGNKKLADVNLGFFPEDVSDDAYQAALDGMDELLGNNFGLAQTRCNDFWEAHREFFKNYFDIIPDGDKPDKDGAGKVPVELHLGHPMTKTRNFNEVSRECSYSISFSTAPNVFSNFMADRTYTASKGQFGSIKIVEKSQLTSYVPKGEDQKKIDPVTGVITDEKDPAPGLVDNPITIIFPEDYRGVDATTGAKARIFAFYNDLLANTIDFTAPSYDDPNTSAPCVQPLKLWSRSVNWNPNGRSVNYSIEYTTDKTVSCLYPDPHGIRKMEVSTDDKLPVRMYKEHAIANWKMMVHDPYQTRLGSRTVNLNVVLERIPKHNMLKDPLLPQVALEELARRAEIEILNVFVDNEDLVPDDMFVKHCRYTFDSKWSATMSIAIDYLQKK